MASISAAESASSELLARILAGEQWTDDLLSRALAEQDGRLFFSVVVERLGDLFEPHLCEQYAKLMARVFRLVTPECDSAELLSRYARVRRLRPCTRDQVPNVFVLSRITLGADVAVTSVLMDAVAARFPTADIWFAGPRKNWELFAGRGRIRHLELSYPRHGSLAERLRSRSFFAAPGDLVVDPDSRITQLGLLPMCREDDYFFFESRAYGNPGNEPLPLLASRWAKEVFRCAGRAFICPAGQTDNCDVAVSFGVGENSEKRVGDVFEEELLRFLIDRGLRVIVDKGAGGAEAERVERLQTLVPGFDTWEGSYAGFANIIANARLYIGYDSAGQHVAAACGVPLVSVFAGYASERMFHRWSPWGPGLRAIVKVTSESSCAILKQTIAAAAALLQ